MVSVSPTGSSSGVETAGTWTTSDHGAETVGVEDRANYYETAGRGPRT